MLPPPPSRRPVLSPPGGAPSFPHSGWLTESATRTGHVAQVWLWGMFSAPHTCWQTPTPSLTLAFELCSHAAVWVGVVCAT